MPKIDLDKVPETNTEWAAQQIATHFTAGEISHLQKTFSRLDKVLYKSWAKDLTLSDLIVALEMQ